MSDKRCTKCGKVKPLEDFNKYAGRSADGYRPICIYCQREYDRIWRKKRRAQK